MVGREIPRIIASGGEDGPPSSRGDRGQVYWD